MSQHNPCVSCGACCAFYRVSFYWAETDDAPGGTVPVAMTVRISPHHVAMRGTETSSPRCCALEGSVGDEVSCGIYPKRSTACREFKVAWQDGLPNPRCDEARRAWGLPPLTPPLSYDPDLTPHAA